MSALEMQQAVVGGAKFARYRAADMDAGALEQAERKRQQQAQNAAELQRQIDEKNGAWMQIRRRGAVIMANGVHGEVVAVLEKCARCTVL